MTSERAKRGRLAGVAALSAAAAMALLATVRVVDREPASIASTALDQSFLER